MSKLVLWFPRIVLLMLVLCHWVSLPALQHALLIPRHDSSADVRLKAAKNDIISVSTSARADWLPVTSLRSIYRSAERRQILSGKRAPGSLREQGNVCCRVFELHHYKRKIRKIRRVEWKKNISISCAIIFVCWFLRVISMTFSMVRNDNVHNWIHWHEHKMAVIVEKVKHSLHWGKPRSNNIMS